MSNTKKEVLSFLDRLASDIKKEKVTLFEAKKDWEGELVFNENKGFRTYRRTGIVNFSVKFLDPTIAEENN